MVFPLREQCAGHVKMSARLGRTCNTHQKSGSVLRLLLLMLPILSGAVLLWGVTVWGKEVLSAGSDLPGASSDLPEAQSLGISRKMQELKEAVAQGSAEREGILKAVEEVLGAHGVEEERRHEILQLTQAAIQKVLDSYLSVPDWALEAIGATIDVERTSKSYGGPGKKTWWLPSFTASSAVTPEAILQPRIMAGRCWAFPGSQGHVVIQLPKPIRPMAFTIWHISEAAWSSKGHSSAPKEFSVSGVDEDTEETLLGSFIYDTHNMVAQTFYVQTELPRTFQHIKFQVHSNWGNPEYTCLYRVQVHGKTMTHNDYPQAQELHPEA